RVLRGAGYLLIAVGGYWIVGLVIYRFFDPPATPLMFIRLSQCEGWDHRQARLSKIDRDLTYAVNSAEDNRLCLHRGVDFTAVGEALEDYQDRGRLRGASTITMQVARNLYLWPGGGVLRKGVEIPLAFAIDLAWPKRRIMEIYLNVVE